MKQKVADPTALWAKVNALDLDPIMVKLMDPEEGKGWDLPKVKSVEQAYKRFLFMSATVDGTIVPTKDIDAFWHQHILDTMKYATDCESVLGFFLHHFPYLGMRGEQDAANLVSAFAETAKIYREMFGEEYSASMQASECNVCGANSCATTTCGNTECSGFQEGTDPSVLQTALRPTLQTSH
jgi:hypothetical protein